MSAKINLSNTSPGKIQKFITFLKSQAIEFYEHYDTEPLRIYYYRDLHEDHHVIIIKSNWRGFIEIILSKNVTADEIITEIKRRSILMKKYLGHIIIALRCVSALQHYADEIELLTWGD
jgi:hypothetical protein